MAHLLADVKQYLPNLILEDLADHPKPVNNPFELHFDAAVMFADISGFSKLAEKITKNNPNGVSELAGILNIYVDKIVDIITNHGGDIVKFAGDATFAVWPVTEGKNLATETHRAVRCGMIIQEKLNNFKVTSGVTMSLTVGLGTGPLHAICVGGIFDRWELLIAGEPMNEVARAGGLAEPGDVVISPSVRRVLEKANLGEKTAPGKFKMVDIKETSISCALYRPDIPENAKDKILAFIPRAIITWLEEGKSPWQADMRQLTVLFLKIDNFQYDDKTEVEEVQKMMKAMQIGLYEYYGSINRFGVDDKGAVLLAAFGLPPFGADDDAAKGLKAAKLLIAELQKIGYSCKIGISTGRAFCGTVGNETRAEYTMHGANVNFAARLMQKAETVLVDEVTYEACKDHLEFKELPPITAKGKDEPVTVYEPIFAD